MMIERQMGMQGLNTLFSVFCSIYIARVTLGFVYGMRRKQPLDRDKQMREQWQ